MSDFPGFEAAIMISFIIAGFIGWAVIELVIWAVSSIFN